MIQTSMMKSGTNFLNTIYIQYYVMGQPILIVATLIEEPMGKERFLASIWHFIAYSIRESSLRVCVNSPEHWLLAYTKYVCSCRLRLDQT